MVLCSSGESPDEWSQGGETPTGTPLRFPEWGVDAIKLPGDWELPAELAVVWSGEQAPHPPRFPSSCKMQIV